MELFQFPLRRRDCPLRGHLIRCHPETRYRIRGLGGAIISDCATLLFGPLHEWIEPVNSCVFPQFTKIGRRGGHFVFATDPFFAFLGLNLFAKLAHLFFAPLFATGSFFRFSGLHDDHANLRTFSIAVLTLIRPMTGEGWNSLMHDLGTGKFEFESVLGVPCETNMRITEKSYKMYAERNLIANPIECGNGMALVFFITFTCLFTFVILNLSVALIFEGFVESQKSGTADIIQNCIEAWPRYDPDYKLLASVADACEFIEECSSRGRGRGRGRG